MATGGMLACNPCDLAGGKARCASYQCPEDRPDLWEAHMVECPSQNLWVRVAIRDIFDAVALPSKGVVA